MLVGFSGCLLKTTMISIAAVVFAPKTVACDDWYEQKPDSNVRDIETVIRLSVRVTIRTPTPSFDGRLGAVSPLTKRFRRLQQSPVRDFEFFVAVRENWDFMVFSFVCVRAQFDNLPIFTTEHSSSSSIRIGRASSSSTTIATAVRRSNRSCRRQRLRRQHRRRRRRQTQRRR
jgi:hypothetical protein